MIKLKDILKEFELERGNAGGTHNHWGDFEIEERFRTLMRGAMKSQEKKTEWGWTATIYEFKLTKKLSDYIKKRTVANVGNGLLVMREKEEGGNSRFGYFLINFNDYTSANDFILGHIATYSTKTKSYYYGPNPKLTFDLPTTTEVVHWSVVHSDFKGKGFGKLLYDSVLDYCGALISDSTLFEGSFNMWTHHMSKKKFFGAIAGSDKNVVLLPLDGNVAANRSFIADRGIRFLAVSDNIDIPEPLRKMQYNLRGVDVTKELVIASAPRSNVNDKLGRLIYGTSASEEYLEDTNIDKELIAVLRGSRSITFVELIEDYMSGFEELIEFNNIRSTGHFYFDNGSTGHSGSALSYTWAPNKKGNMRDWNTGWFKLNPKDASKLKLMIIAMDDAILFVKETGDGLSVSLY